MVSSNNLRDAVAAVVANPADAAAILDAAISNVIADNKTALEQLIAAGAHHILVPNAPNLARTPEVVEIANPLLSGFAMSVSQAFNLALDQLLADLSATHIMKVDVFSALEAIAAAPTAAGFTNTSERCYTGGFRADQLGEVCTAPEGYVFWDSQHPTAAAHKILGDLALATVVPLPGTGLLILIGLLALARRESLNR